MSKKWTDQQKVLHQIKLIGGARKGSMAITFMAKWGYDRVVNLFNTINKDEMGIDNANSILSMSNELGPKAAKNLLWSALSSKYDNHKHDNVIPLRRES